MKVLITSISAVICEDLVNISNYKKFSRNDKLIIYSNSRNKNLKTDFNIDWTNQESIKNSGISEIVFDVVINTAGVAYQMNAINQNPYTFLSESNLITKNILLNLRFNQFIQISSPSIYYVDWLKRKKFDLNKTHNLGEIKLSDDILAKTYCYEFKKNINIVRPQSILSKREEPREINGHVFSELTFKILNKQLNFLDIKALSTQELVFLSPKYMWIDIFKLLLKNSENIVKVIKGKEKITIIQFVKEICSFGFLKKIIDKDVTIKFKDKEITFSSNNVKFRKTNNYQFQLIRNYLKYHYEK